MSDWNTIAYSFGMHSCFSPQLFVYLVLVQTQLDYFSLNVIAPLEAGCSSCLNVLETGVPNCSCQLQLILVQSCQ